MADIRSKRLKRIKMQAFLTCFLSLGTLAAAGSATFAWFTTNKTAKASYLNIVATDSAIVESVNYYKIKSVDTTNNIYTFSTTTATATDIGLYDSALGSEEHQILIKINFKSTTTASYTINAGANSDILNGGNSWSTIDWENADSYPLSSIIKFNYFGTDATEGTDTIVVTKTTGITDSSFITMSNDTPSFAQKLSLGSGTAPTSVYIMLDYNVEAITSIYSANIGVEKFETSESLSFSCDFSITVTPTN